MKRSVLAVASTVVAATVVAALAASGCGDSKTTVGGTYTTIDGNHTIDPQAPINPYHAKGNAFSGYNAMPLGFPRNHLTDHNLHYPAVAEGWEVSPDDTVVTVKIKTNAKWSDGKPVTAEDVRTSAAVAFTQAASVFQLTPGTPGALGEVTVVDEKTIKFTQAAGTRNTMFLRGVLAMWVLPTSVYGSQLPNNFWDMVKLGASADPAQQDAAAKARNDIKALGKKIVAFGPSKDVSAGPFVLDSVNASEAILVKNKNFHDAPRIGPDKVRLRNYTGNEQIWNYLTAGELDSAPDTSTPTRVVEQILKVPGSQRITSLSQASAALAFNATYPPFDKVEVRRALAYLIDRAQVRKVGEPDSGKVAEHTTGLIEDAAKAWIGPDEVARLNPYNVDRSKAEYLFTKAGLTKRNGTWTLANGQPFSFKIQVPGELSDWVAGAKNIAGQLTDFGIAVETRTSADFAAYQTEMTAGKHAVGFWLIALGPATYDAYSRLYGSGNGWTAVGGRLTRSAPGADGNWLGSPERVTVAGVGTINPGEVTHQLSHLPVDQARATILKLAKYTNDQLPVIQLWNYVNVQFVNTTRYENFPPNDCECLRLPDGVWMQLGYIQPLKK